MLSFFRPANPALKHPVASEKTGDPVDITIVSTSVLDASPLAQPPTDAEPRPSSASVPTIDSTPTVQGPPGDPPQTPAHPHSIPLPQSPNPAASLVASLPATAQTPAPSVHTQSSAHDDRPMQSQSQSALPYSPPSANSTGKDPRRFSFPSFSLLRSDPKQNKARTTVSKASEKKSMAGRALSVLTIGTAASSERRAKESASLVRSIIVGDCNNSFVPNSGKIKSPSKSDIVRVKAQLLDSKTAAKVVGQLRTLPAHPDDNAIKTDIPIHAVSLEMPDKDVHEQYFAQFESVATASLSAISAALADVHLVNLITAPNMGFGAPVTAQGLFAGAVPTAETVIYGVEQFTPQLMALGYATGKAILPDHKGVIVPTDRISALTYWWGFEICLPPPTIAHLQAAASPSTALLNLLTALAILSEGVRELLPFIRYIAQFAQTEWSMIKKADKGKGVVCTATWLLPVAIVPHTWDFSDLPPPPTEADTSEQNAPMSPSVQRFSAALTTPKPSMEVPNNSVPRSSSAYSVGTRDEEESRSIIPSQPPVLPEVVVSSPASIDGGDREAHGIQHDEEATAH